LPLLFALTLFLSAFLLFLMQPMIGKVVLPYLGGTPQVWNTCMVFFQAALLLGYLYSHEITRRFGLKKQLAFHFVLLLLPLAPLAFLKLDVGQIAREWLEPPTDSNPIPWLLGVLALVAGLPFFVVATSAPLLQKWYSDTGATGAKDPYFLYGASNLGSMLALVAYPTVIEPNLALPQQARLWVVGYASLLTLTLLCGLLARVFSKASKLASARPERSRWPSETDSDTEYVSPTRRLRWILLAFVPSSLMLGVTTYVTTDVAPVPLLWIIPLTLYLLSFILVFTRLPQPFPALMLVLLIGSILILAWPTGFPPADISELREVRLAEVFKLNLPPVLAEFIAIKHVLYFLSFVLTCLLLPRLTHVVMVLLLPALIVMLVLPQWSGKVFEFGWDEREVLGLTLPAWQTQFTMYSWHINALHFLAMFVAAMVCHGELARTRPTTRNLTGFYLCMSVGGVLGGVFNTVVAPLAFNSLVEYPLVMAGACLLLPQLGLSETNPAKRLTDLLVPSALAAFGVVAAFIFLMRDPTIEEFFYHQTQRLPLSWQQHTSDWVQQFTPIEHGVLHAERGFFGVVRVRLGYDERAEGLPIPKWQGRYHVMQHGAINHGMQRMQLSPAGAAVIHAPLAACSQPLEAALNVIIRQEVHRERRRDEPIAYFQSTGPIGDLFAAAKAKKKKLCIGVLGMGTGTLAGYAEPDWEMDYYEIDPAVVRMANNEHFFTYLPDAERRGVKIKTFLGDGRLQIQKNAPDGAYDLLFMDAFSSDSVPVHLLTKEAIQMYLTKLDPHGIIVVNIANRYLDFAPIFGNLAADLQLAGLFGYSRNDYRVDLYGCDWVVLARAQGDFGMLNELVEPEPPFPFDYEGWRPNKGWLPLWPDERLGVWTDDFSNLLSVFDWNR
jgi:hypothetical protein